MFSIFIPNKRYEGFYGRVTVLIIYLYIAVLERVVSLKRSN